MRITTSRVRLTDHWLSRTLMAFLTVASLPAPAMAAEYLTGAAGGTGGTAFSIRCSTDTPVLAGVEGKASGLVDRIAPVCVQTDAQGHWLGSPVGYITDLNMVNGSVGGSGGSPFRLQCPANHAVSGIQGKAGLVIDRLQIFCGALGTNGQLKSVGSLLAGKAGGDGGNPFGPLHCAENKPARGLSGRAQEFVDQIRLACDFSTTPKLTYVRVLGSASSAYYKDKLGNVAPIHIRIEPAPHADLIVALTSSNPSVASVPSQIGTRGGDVYVPSLALGCTTIEAAYLGVKKGVRLLVDGANAPQLGVSINKDFWSSEPTTATLTIPIAAKPGGVAVSLSSSHPKIVPLPASVVIPAGSKITSFDFSTRNWSKSDACVVITATGNGATVSRVGLARPTQLRMNTPNLPPIGGP